MNAKITVKDDGEGISRLSGYDEQGCHYIQFEVDYFALQLPGQCARCDKEIESGWLCLDGGEEYCEDCVNFERDD